MLDEVGKRKADKFDEANSVPVMLADGQAWHIPKPWYTICPVFEAGKAKTSYPFYTYGKDDDELIEFIGEAETLSTQICGVATLAARLLQHQYELTDSELDQLLCFRDGEPDSEEWLRAVMRVATGCSGPKVFAAGAD
jgi:hypothetical protein